MSAAQITKAEAESFLAAEMRLIDEWRLEEWLRLFLPEAIYWFPREWAAERRRENALIYDGAREREIRVRQLMMQHLAQMPRSETVHACSNVEVEACGDAEVLVRCALVLYETRPGAFHSLDIERGALHVFPARCAYRLRRAENAWKIAEKKVLLLARAAPIYNLTFVV